MVKEYRMVLDIKLDTGEDWEVEEYINAVSEAAEFVREEEEMRWVSFAIYCRTGRFPEW